MRSASYATSSASSSKLIFRRLFEKKSSNYTYLLADASRPDKPALLVDPLDKTVDRDVSLVKELCLKLIYGINTHVHADHVTGTGLLKSKVPGVQSIISKASNAKADLFVEHGDENSIYKFHQSISQILPSRFNLSLNFHQFAPSKPRRNPSVDGDNSKCPNLLNHKDWLSQPEVIRIFQNLKNPNFTLPLLDQLSSRKDYNPNESLYTTLINKLAGANHFDAMEALMERIKLERKCRLSDGFFRNVIKIYGHSAGRINKAIDTLFDMPNYKCWPSVTTFNCVLNLLVSSKQFEVVHEVYMGASDLGVEIDACCLNIIIKGLCECGKIEAAFKVLDEFPQQKCSPNTRTFSTIMHGLCDLGRVDESFHLLQRMEEEGIEVDAIVFNILISGLRKQGQVEKGVELFDSMMLKGCNPNLGTYQEVLYCFLAAKRLYEAKSLMENMIDKGINPSFDSYKMIIRGFCSENRVEDVEWALKEMVEHGFVPKMGMWKQIVQCIVSEKNGVVSDCVSV